MKNFLYIEDIPSNRSDVLDSLKGLKILNLTRYCWEPPDREVSEYGIEAKDVFSLAPGPLIMSFDSVLVTALASVMRYNKLKYKTFK